MESSIADTAAATSVVRTAKQVTEEAEACAALAWGGRKLGPTAEKALGWVEPGQGEDSLYFGVTVL